MMTLKPGTLFAKHYEVVRVISAGGMGVVYEVFHKETKRRRALKIMLPHVLEEADMRDRFALEAVVTAEIESEHLIEVFDAGIEEESQCPFIVMELLRGEDLGKRVTQGQRYSPAEVLVFIDQIALALEKTHARGIVHRDLKPENIFITRRDDGSPRVKILDFGIAKLVKSTGLGTNKNTTRSFGTPYYMAREQLTGEAKLIGPSSDLYAVAHIVFTMLVGTPYFAAEAEAASNVLALLMAVGQGGKDPASVRAANKGVELPPAFDDWFAKATDIDPARRFQRAGEMARALRNAFAEGNAAFAKTSSASGDVSLSRDALRASAPSSLAPNSAVPSTPPPSDLAPVAASATSSDQGKSPLQIAGSSQGFTKTALPPSEPRPRASRAPIIIAASVLGVGALIGIAVFAFKDRSASGEPTQTSSAAQREASATETANTPPAIEPSVAVLPSRASNNVSIAGSTASSVAASSAASSVASATGKSRTDPPPRIPDTTAAQLPPTKASTTSTAASTKPVWTER
ncbi:MAG: protein kinase [Polyangiaceae bacterium]